MARQLTTRQRWRTSKYPQITPTHTVRGARASAYNKYIHTYILYLSVWQCIRVCMEIHWHKCQHAFGPFPRCRFTRLHALLLSCFVVRLKCDVNFKVIHYGECKYIYACKNVFEGALLKSYHILWWAHFRRQPVRNIKRVSLLKYWGAY